MRLLPQRTQDLLRGHTDEQAVQIGETYFFWLRGRRGVACPEMTIEEARALDRIFLEVGFERSETAWGLYYDIKARNVFSIRVIPLLPDGEAQPVLPRVSAVSLDRPLTETPRSVRSLDGSGRGAATPSSPNPPLRHREPASRGEPAV